MGEPLIAVEAVSHWFGSGTLKKQILTDVSCTIDAGEIVILTGPSGSGKTTLLSLIGALRGTQAGSLRVLGQELRDASEATLVGVRRRIGFIFQLHNLLDALTVTENVEMGLHRGLGLSHAVARERSIEVLGSVGLGERVAHYPDQLSGGQKQRVAIARALAGRPRIILADEPTASLDKQSGREVVDRIRDLAKREGCVVLLVTHDNRILDVADRIIHLEEGRLSSFADAVRANTQQLLETLAKAAPGPALREQLAGMTATAFTSFLEQFTTEARQVLDAMTLGADGAFERMIEQVIESVTFKVGELLGAERTSLLLADDARGELWSKVVQTEGGRPVEIRIPATSGISGQAYRTGVPVRVADADESPLFNPETDRKTGYRTRSMLSVPIADADGRPFAVLGALNKQGGGVFDEADEQRAVAIAAQLGVILQTWHRAHVARTGPTVGA